MSRKVAVTMLSFFVSSALLGSLAAVAAETITLADVAELSGSGATVGTNWKNGIDLAVAEINAHGGILGAKVVVTHADSQSNPGVARAQVLKALGVTLGQGWAFGRPEAQPKWTPPSPPAAPAARRKGAVESWG